MLEQNGKSLYGIGFTLWNPKTRNHEASFAYTHARNVDDARFQFMMSLPLKARYEVKIQAIGPAVGAWEHETKSNESRIIML